jgi:copper transport protein
VQAITSRLAAASLAEPSVWGTAVARWLLFVGLSVALGGLAGRGLARQVKLTAPVPLPGPWALRGSLLGALASAALALGAHPTVPLIELASFLIAAGLLRLRQPRWSVLPLLAVVVAEGARAHPEKIIPVAGAAITYCHLIPAAIWVGMLFYTLRAAIAWRGYPSEMRAMLRLYGNAAAWLLSIVVITGVIAAIVLVPLHSLLTTPYGRVLIVKAVLVGVAVVFAAAGRVWLNQPQRGTGPARVTKLECATLAAVLAVAGLLTALTPPATPIRSAIPTPPPPSAHRTLNRQLRPESEVARSDRPPGRWTVGPGSRRAATRQQPSRHTGRTATPAMEAILSGDEYLPG